MLRQTFRCSLLVCVALFTNAVHALAVDWSNWRGPEQNGYVRENATVTKWSLDGENLLWKSPEGGRTTPLVMNGKVYFIGPAGEDTCLQERVVCLDANTGKTLWDNRFNVFFTDIVADRVGWTALAGDPETGNVYAHGTGGQLLCFSGDGKLLWQHSLMEEYNRVSGYGGRMMSPLVDEDRVIISFLNTNWGNHAKPGHRYIAFDKRNGAVLWWSEMPGTPVDTTYATPIVAVIDGKRLIIAPAADGVVYGLEARTGRLVWQYKLSKLGLNASPVAVGKHIFVSHSEENPDTTTMGRMACIDGSKTGDITKTGEIWRLDGMDAGYASPAYGDGRLYAVDNSANLHAIDAVTGKLMWKYKLGRVGKGSPIVTMDHVIYVGEQNGTFLILKDAGAHCELLSKQEFAPHNGAIDELFGSPAIANGRVYFMTRYGSYCLGSKDAKVETAVIPPMPAESGEKSPVAYMEIVPADATLNPGTAVKFEPRLFNANGIPVNETPQGLQWSLSGLFGVLNQQGEFNATKKFPYTTGVITAKAGQFSASARVRVTPSLPFLENFEQLHEGLPPSGWVGTVGKTKVVMHDGWKVLQKLAEKGKPSPVWKMRAFATPPISGGYTVDADLEGTLSRRFRPDMGLINTRYELILLGMQKELELSRWRDEPTHSLRKRIPYELKENLWYTFKLRVALKDGKAKVSGKVWPRDQKEPPEWTIEFDDPCPNTEGSPGIFVYSNGTTDKSDGASVYIDNFKVSGNE
jgi:outer membrane protein assembly factor BamB